MHFILAVIASAQPLFAEIDAPAESARPATQQQSARHSSSAQNPSPRNKSTGWTTKSRLHSFLLRPQFEDRYRAVLQQTRRGRRPEPVAVTHEVLALYEAVKTVDGFTRQQKKTFRRVLRGRLVRLRDDLQRQVRKSRGTAAKTNSAVADADQRPAFSFNSKKKTLVSGKKAGSDKTKGAGLLGPGDRYNANQLIEIIQTVIAPGTWEADGGVGRILYFEPLQVLVIRQTQDVHEKIGGNFRGFRNP